MTALLPPSSNNDFPNRAPTTSPTDLPILVDPVAETSGTLLSSAISLPKFASPITSDEIPSGSLFSLITWAMMF